MKVSSLLKITNHVHHWDMEKLYEIIPIYFHDKVAQLNVTVDAFKDETRWKHSRDGKYIVKTAYNRMSSTEKERRKNGFGGIWNIWVQPKVNHRIWRITH